MIGIASADAAAGDDRVRIRRGFAEHGFELFGLVRHVAEVQNLHAQLGQQTEQGKAIAVVHSAFARRLAGCQNLIAGGEISHPQGAHHLDLRKAQAGQQTQRGRRDAFAARQGHAALHQVFACAAAIGTGAQRVGGNVNAAVGTGAGQFEWHHGVQPRRHHRAGHDAHALAAGDGAGPGVPSQCRGNALELQRLSRLQRGPIKGKAVHRGVVVRRHADRGNHIARQNATECGAQVQRFRLGDGLNQLRKKRLHGIHVHVFAVVVLDAGGDGVQGGHAAGKFNSGQWDRGLAISRLS